MAQPPMEPNYYHTQHGHGHALQQQLVPQYPFNLLIDDHTAAMNYNSYMRPILPNLIKTEDALNDSLVMRRPRRTRTTFTSAQIAELEQHFRSERYLTSSRLIDLSAKLGLGTAQVKIWFKNRRRRQKIQLDQQKEHLQQQDDIAMSISPSLSQQQQHVGSSGATTPTTLTPSPTPTSLAPTVQVNVHDPYGGGGGPCFSYYNSNNISKNNMNQHGAGGSYLPHHGPSRSLPPPLVPIQQASHHVYHANQAHNHVQLPHMHHGQFSHMPPDPSIAVTQFLPPPLHHHHLHQQQQQQQQQQQSQHHIYPGHNRHHNHVPHGFQQHPIQYHGQTRYENISKMPISADGGGHIHRDDTEFNFNNGPFYGHLSTTGTTAASSVVANNNNNNNNNHNNHNSNYTVSNSINRAGMTMTATAAASLAMSSHGDAYEPLTPKHDESPSLSNSGGCTSSSASGSCSSSSANSSAGVADEMDEPNSTITTKTTLQVLRANRANVSVAAVATAAAASASVVVDDTCNNVATTLQGIAGSFNQINMDDCSEAFAKYSKSLNVMSNDVHDPPGNAYQCTMDTLMNAYNSHRNAAAAAAASSTQFAYCFN